MYFFLNFKGIGNYLLTSEDWVIRKFGHWLICLHQRYYIDSILLFLFIYLAVTVLDIHSFINILQY